MLPNSERAFLCSYFTRFVGLNGIFLNHNPWEKKKKQKSIKEGKGKGKGKGGETSQFTMRIRAFGEVKHS